MHRLTFTFWFLTDIWRRHGYTLRARLDEPHNGNWSLHDDWLSFGFRADLRGPGTSPLPFYPAEKF
jgi:hypothetical protein